MIMDSAAADVFLIDKNNISRGINYRFSIALICRIINFVTLLFQKQLPQVLP